MDVSFGMEQWLIWGGIGLAAILALFGMSSWLRSNKKKMIDVSATDVAGAAIGSVTGAAGDLGDIAKGAISGAGGVAGSAMDTAGGLAGGVMNKAGNMATGAVNGDTQLDMSGVTAHQAKTSGWGFWPWALLSLLVMGALAWLIWTTWGMTGMAAIKWIFASLLGLGALFTIMGFFQMIRRHPLVDEKRGSPRGLGFLTMITGLVLAGASWFVWQPKIASLGGLSEKISGYEFKIKVLESDYAHQSRFNKEYKSDISGYKAKITGFESQTAGLSTENTRLGGVISGLKKKLSLNMADGDEVSRLTGVVKGLNSNNGDLLDENKRLKGLLSSNTANGDEITRLKGVVSGLNTKVSGLNKDVAVNDGEILRLKGFLNENDSSNNDEITRLTGLLAGLTTDKGNLATENTRMNGLIGSYKNDSQVQSAKIASLEADNAKISGLETEIETLRNKPPVIKTVTKTVTVPAAAAIGSTGTTPLAMIHAFEANQDTSLQLRSGDFNIIKADRRNMVTDKDGRFYFIDVIDPATGKGYKFESAQYSRIKNQGRFKKSLDRIIANIKGAFDGKRAYQLYVKGKASAGRYQGNMAKGFEYTDMKVLPRVPKASEDEPSRWQDTLADRKYEKTIGNDDLPNLRGAFLQEFIAKNYDVKQPVILDGKVSKSAKASKQAVSVILYVEN